MVIFKVYFHFENEEKWLNQMSAKGCALVYYSWCRYHFEPCRPGEYTYRLELLENLPSHPKSAQYIDFMASVGAELVCAYQRWAYFRRKAEEGPFDIYSDADSRIKHYKRIVALWGIIGLANGMNGLNTAILSNGYADARFATPVAVLCLALSALLLGLCAPYLVKIRRLRAARSLRE